MKDFEEILIRNYNLEGNVMYYHRCTSHRTPKEGKSNFN